MSYRACFCSRDLCSDSQCFRSVSRAHCAGVSVPLRQSVLSSPPFFRRVLPNRTCSCLTVAILTQEICALTASVLDLLAEHIVLVCLCPCGQVSFRSSVFVPAFLNVAVMDAAKVATTMGSSTDRKFPEAVVCPVRKLCKTWLNTLGRDVHVVKTHKGTIDAKAAADDLDKKMQFALFAGRKSIHSPMEDMGVGKEAARHATASGSGEADARTGSQQGGWSPLRKVGN